MPLRGLVRAKATTVAEKQQGFAKAPNKKFKKVFDFKNF